MAKVDILGILDEEFEAGSAYSSRWLWWSFYAIGAQFVFIFAQILLDGVFSVLAFVGWLFAFVAWAFMSGRAGNGTARMACVNRILQKINDELSRTESDDKK